MSDGNGAVAPVFGPDVTVPANIEAASFWAEIPANDDTGVTVDGIKKGDVVEMRRISGICSFSEEVGLQKVLGFVALVAGVVSGGASLFGASRAAEIATAVKDQATAVREKAGSPSGGKRRDGFGQDPGTGDYARKEGGIIVCMPKAKGALYAIDEHYLGSGAKDDGRVPMHVSPAIRDTNSFFPCREDGGVMRAVAQEDGAINIVAFDKEFVDNMGDYEVKFRVMRPPSGQTAEGLVEKLRLLEQQAAV